MRVPLLGGGGSQKEEKMRVPFFFGGGEQRDETALPRLQRPRSAPLRRQVCDDYSVQLWLSAMGLDVSNAAPRRHQDEATSPRERSDLIFFAGSLFKK